MRIVFALPIVIYLMSLAGCASNQKLQQLLEEKNKLQIEYTKVSDELSLLRQDWHDLQNEESAAKLVLNLREKLRKAEEYRSSVQSMLSSNTETIDWLRSQNDDLTKSIRQSKNTIVELQKELSACQKTIEATISQRIKGGVYINLGGGHWISKVIDGGRFVLLEDGSLWEISSIDRINTAIWLPITDIMVLENQAGVFPYTLVNTDDRETAEAKYIGNQ